MHSTKIVLIITVILAIIFGASVFTNRTLSSHAQSIEKKISTVEANTRDGKWEAAETELAAIEEEWPRVEKIWAVLLDHAEIDNIDEALSKVSEYVKSKSAPLALAELASLKKYINHIPVKESFNLKNVL
ncbi:DUF4363 family protein [Acetivibrio cellulolyticus]|uniref:DUF4363 family protein n=1 Tax=Acetivibrio cellulolyticus TaxID=35830 RepID=UPI0001E2D433|nr:DUF4363 family protein [Acetivibrio cellulolyticus]